MKPLISTLALLSLLVTSAVYAGPGAAAAASHDPAHIVPGAADTKVAADVKSAAANASWFGRLAREQHTNFDITRRLHAFVLAQAQYQVSGEESNKISACAHQVLDNLVLNNLESAFPRPLANIIGAYATAARSIDIDWLLVKISQSDFKPLMEQQFKSADDTVTASMKGNPERFASYRALQKHGVPYPLSATEIQRWIAAGFAFRPMMMKRDRMVCDHCQEAVQKPAAPDGSPQAPPAIIARDVARMLYVNGDYSDSRSYMEPVDYHNYSKKHPEHLAELQAQAIQNPAVCENLPDPKTPEFLRHVLRHVHLRAWTITQFPANQLPPDISADLFAAVKLWCGFNSACAQMMGWTLFAHYADNPVPWDSLPPGPSPARSAALQRLRLPVRYASLQELIMQVPKV